MGVWIWMWILVNLWVDTEWFAIRLWFAIGVLKLANEISWWACIDVLLVEGFVGLE